MADALAGARLPKLPSRVATTAALPANTRTGNVLTADANGALAAIDGVALSLDDPLVVKDEATGANNGFYTLTALGDGSNPWTMTRAALADTDAEVGNGMSSWVGEGTANGKHRFVLQTADPITLNTTALTFLADSGLGQVTAGAGLTKSGDTIDANPDGTTMEVASDQLRLKDLGVSTAKLAADAVSTAKVADDAVTLAKLADQKAEIALASTTPVLADLTSLTADGHWALGKGTDDSAWYCTMVGAKKFAVQIGEITS